MGLKDWAKGKAAAGGLWAKGKAKAAPGFTAKETLAGVKSAPFVVISKFLIVFLFAILGYNFGIPLIIPTWIANGLWGIINFIVTLFPIAGIPAFLFDYALVAVKGTTGFFLNAWFGLWLIKKWNSDKSNIGKFFVHLFIVFPLLWMWFSMALTIAYTGYVPIVTPLTGTSLSPSLCDFQNSFQTSVGLEAPGCSISELEVQVGLLAEQQKFAADTQTGLLGGLFGSVTTDAGGGTVFKSRDVNDESVVNRGAGSSLSSLRSPKLSFTAYGGVAEDLKFLANLETKSLFLSNFGDSKIKVAITPSISNTVCSSCFTSSCTSEEINDPFTAYVGGTAVNFEKGAGLLDRLGITDCTNTGDPTLKCFEKEWCSSEWVCNIPGATPVEGADNTFKVGSGYNQQIECAHAGLSIDQDEVKLSSGALEYPQGKPIPLYVDLSYDTRAVSSKQFFIIDREISQQEIDPIKTLGLSDFVISKSYSDGKVSFGIGTTNSYDFIAPTYNTDYAANIIDLGVSFKMNAAGGHAIKIANATLWVQVVDPSIKFLCGLPPEIPVPQDDSWEVTSECDENSLNDLDKSGNFKYLGDEDGYHRFRLNLDRAKTELGVAEVVNYDVKMFVPEEALAGADYQGILVESEINYTYTTRDNLMLRVSPDEFLPA